MPHLGGIPPWGCPHHVGRDASVDRDMHGVHSNNKEDCSHISCPNIIRSLFLQSISPYHRHTGVRTSSVMADASKRPLSDGEEAGPSGALVEIKRQRLDEGAVVPAGPASSLATKPQVSRGPVLLCCRLQARSPFHRTPPLAIHRVHPARLRFWRPPCCSQATRIRCSP